MANPAVNHGNHGKSSSGLVQFQEMHDNREELYGVLHRQAGIEAIPLERSQYMDFGCLSEYIDKNPITPKLQGHIPFFKRLEMMPLGVDKEDSGLLIAIRDESPPDQVAVKIGMEFSDYIAKPLNLDTSKIRYIILSSGDFEKASRFVENSSERKGFLSQIDETTGAILTYYTLIRRGIELGATDIHIEPFGEYIERGELKRKNRVRFRMDGVLQEMPYQISPDKLPALVRVCKLRGKMPKHTIDDIPQDGSIIFNDEQFIGDPQMVGERFPNLREELRGYSLRLATMPTIRGEKLAIRILDSKQQSYELKRLGFEEGIEKQIRALAEMPQGMIIITGPTGSGKTTTLYSILQSINTPEVNILTIEDPVEKSLAGLNQSAVNRAKDWDFGTCLRAYLRHDPDIILVGEIRDKETGDAAVQAASTGHLVLSTMHTNNSIDSIIRLTEFGIESFMIQANLTAVLAQRLARRVCPECRTNYDAREDFSGLLRENFEKPVNIYRANHKKEPFCKNCNGTGYRGRTSVSELWVLGDEEREMILDGVKSHRKFYDVARKGGMQPLVCSGLDLVLQGVTDINEILNTTASKGEFLAKRDLLIQRIRRYQEKTEA